MGLSRGAGSFGFSLVIFGARGTAWAERMHASLNSVASFISASEKSARIASMVVSPRAIMASQAGSP